MNVVFLDPAASAPSFTGDRVALYVKSDGALYSKKRLTAEERLSVPTGGAAGQVLKRAEGGGLEWADPESVASISWPVGSVFVAVVATSPAELLGFGTWVRFGAGRMLVSQDDGNERFDVAEEEGGSEEITLTVDQMPVHTHVQDAHLHGLPSNAANTGAGSQWPMGGGASNAGAGGLTSSVTAINQNAGGGQPHDNMPPYVVVYMWKRTA